MFEPDFRLPKKPQFNEIAKTDGSGNWLTLVLCLLVAGSVFAWWLYRNLHEERMRSQEMERMDMGMLPDFLDVLANHACDPVIDPPEGRNHEQIHTPS